MLRSLATRTLGATGLGRMLRRLGRWEGVLVLNYHRVGDWSDPLWDRGLWSASAPALAEQLGVLAREAEVVRADELEAAVHAGRGRRVALTFDDGYRDNHDVALPALRAAGLQATFFVATGFLDRPRVPWWDEVAWMVRRSPRPFLPATGPLAGPIAWGPGDDREPQVRAIAAALKPLRPAELEALLDDLADATGSGRCPVDWTRHWMTWDMVRALREGGMAVGAHTIGHPMLSALDADEQRAEIEGSLARLRAELGEPVTLFSYPYGLPSAHDARTIAILREAGVETAFTYFGGVARPGGWDPLAVPRASVAWSMDGAQFRSLVTLPRAFARW